MGSLYNDYNRLYSFARGEQRAFLDFYFLHYEAAYLKGCLRKVISGQSIQEDQAYRSAFLRVIRIWIQMRLRIAQRWMS